MGLKRDNKYSGTITTGSRLISTQSGSLGYQINLICEDGETMFIVWLTPKNRAKAIKTFEMLGVTRQNLSNRSYLDLQLSIDIEGKEVSFGTREEEYNGKKSIKVSWIGKKSSADPAKDAADFFSQAPASDVQQAEDNGPPIQDEDLPF